MKSGIKSLAGNHGVKLNPTVYFLFFCGIFQVVVMLAGHICYVRYSLYSSRSLASIYSWPIRLIIARFYLISAIEQHCSRCSKCMEEEKEAAFYHYSSFPFFSLLTPIKLYAIVIILNCSQRIVCWKDFQDCKTALNVKKLS